MKKLSPAALAVEDAIKDWMWDAPCPGFVEAIASAAILAAVEECAGLPDGSDCTTLLTEIANELKP